MASICDDSRFLCPKTGRLLPNALRPLRGYYCTLRPGHPGAHVAGTTGVTWYKPFIEVCQEAMRDSVSAPEPVELPSSKLAISAPSEE